MDARRTDKLLLLTLLLLLARHAWLATHIHPYADDLNYAALGLRHDLGERLAEEYRSWNGRWASNVAVLSGPLTWAPAPALAWYRLMPVLFILLTALSAFALLRTLFREALDQRRTWLAALGFTALYLHLMPHLGQGIYWYTGAVTYQLANVFILLHLSALLRLEQGGRRTTWLVIGGLTLLLAAGSNEVAMLLLLAFHALRVWIIRREQGRVPALSIAFLALAVVAAAFMAAAPGNSVRAQHFPARHDPFLTLAWSTIQTGRFGLGWSLAPALLVSVLLILPVCRVLADRSKSFAAMLDRPWHMWLAITFGMIFLVMVLPYWSTGLLGQHRTVNVALFFFIPLWCLALAAMDHQLVRPRGWRIPLATRWGRHVALVLLLASLVYAGNDRWVTLDLLDGTAARHDAHMRTRYITIQMAIDAGAAQVVVPPMQEVPRSLSPLDAGTDPDHWMNRGLAAWLGDPHLRVVVAEE